MCGIFAYLNYKTPVTRKQISDILINGLRRLEYRGYDSAGIAVDENCPDCNGDCINENADPAQVLVIRRPGKVEELSKAVNKILSERNDDPTFDTHVGIAHTRWATHGKPNENNAHPQSSDITHAFTVVHNGIITNFKDLRSLLERKGVKFETETDTEVIPKLMFHLYELKGGSEKITFEQLVEETIRELDGSFALACKSRFYPGEIVATRRGSPLLLGIKSQHKLTMDQIPISYPPKGETLILIR